MIAITSLTWAFMFLIVAAVAVIIWSFFNAFMGARN